MKTYQRLLLENKAWAAERLEDDPEYFTRRTGDQSPLFLWIGCSDSRVPAETVTNTEPGELFVHRNVANLVVQTDFNLLSVLQYAIEVLHVHHIIVCGHYGCGGIRASLDTQTRGLLDSWLWTVKDVYHEHEKELDALEPGRARERRLVELNVMEQVLNLAKTPTVQSAWSRGPLPMLHGWVYELATGELKPQIYGGVELLDKVHRNYRFEPPE